MSRSVAASDRTGRLGRDAEALADEVARLAAFLDEMGTYPAPAGELSVAFLTDAELARLHGDFLGDPSATDVMTFPGDPGMAFAGEICISLDRAEAAAREHGTSPAREVVLYLVHGWLHLAGLDDRDPGGRAAMRRAEAEILTALDRAGAVPDLGLPDGTEHAQEPG